MGTERIIKNHMEILWHEYTDAGGEERPVTEASLTEKASIVGRVGIMLLSCGTGAWRVRSSMNTLSEVMGITCTADIGLMSIEYTCFDGEQGFTQSLCLTNTGVNTSKLNRLEHFIREFEKEGCSMSGEQLHQLLDEIERIHGLYSPVALGFAAALACGGFTFLLGGGPIEMFCAFSGAGLGNFLRCKLTKHHFTLFLGIVSSVALACLVYAGFLKIAEVAWGVSVQHEAGYICAMLFIIPGFPFITSGIDLAKLDMRSGVERFTYALIVVLVATMSAWIMALILHLQPVDFEKMSLPLEAWILFRLLASFCGVFGFSVMFNSPVRLAAVAAGIGMVSPQRIDEINILQATYEAMREAVGKLDPAPDLLLNDAVTIPGVEIRQVPIIKGDAKSISIGAASIVAKVTRDRLMEQYADVFPEYDFASNKGYGSAAHIAALKEYGPTPIHRHSFIKNFGF